MWNKYGFTPFSKEHLYNNIHRCHRLETADPLQSSAARAPPRTAFASARASARMRLVIDSLHGEQHTPSDKLKRRRLPLSPPADSDTDDLWYLATIHEEESRCARALRACLSGFMPVSRLRKPGLVLLSIASRS